MFATGILYDAWRRYVDGSDPLGIIIIVMTLISAAINAECVWLLARLRNPDVNFRAANTFSWNDFTPISGSMSQRVLLLGWAQAGRISSWA